MLRVLITDGMEKAAIEKLRQMNLEVVEHHYKEEELIEEIKNYDILIVRSATKVRKSIIDGAHKTKKLKLIIRGGVGIDNISADYANEKGIIVRNTPNSSSISVAELVIGHMFNLTRHIYNENLNIRNGIWNKKDYQGVEIWGKTLGIIGMGRIGVEVAKRAKALGMNVIYYDEYEINNKKLDYKYCTLDKLLTESDFISLHVPFILGQNPVIGEKEIGKMKRGAYIINCARGGVVDEQALIDALDNGKLGGAAMDVFVEEPVQNPPLCNHHKVSLTPHVGASTKEAQLRIGEEIISIIEDFMQNEESNTKVENF